jgi:hypothetical protein
VNSKAAGIYPLAAAEKLATFPVKLLETIKWIDAGKYPVDIIANDLKSLVADIIRVLPDNSNCHRSL